MKKKIQCNRFCFILFGARAVQATTHKIVKHTQTICWQIADELFDHFVGLAFKRLRLLVNIKLPGLYKITLR